VLLTIRFLDVAKFTTLTPLSLPFTNNIRIYLLHICIFYVYLQFVIKLCILYIFCITCYNFISQNVSSYLI
jgi:hypothetical protein